MKKGFIVRATPEQVEKQDREKRMKERKEKAPKNVTNTEIYEYLKDTNDRLSEIYDLLKQRQ